MFSGVQDRYRFYGAILYGIFFVFGIFLLIYYHHIFFYNIPKNDFSNWPRFIFTIIASFFGFIFIAYESSKTHNTEPRAFSPILSYLSRYLLILLLCDAVIFGILSSIASTSNYIFYYLSSVLGIAIGYYIDIFATYFFNIIIKIISKNIDI